MTKIILHRVDADGWELNKNDDRFEVGSDERITLWLSHFPIRGEVILWEGRPHKVLDATLQGVSVDSKAVPLSPPRLLVIETEERSQVVTEAPSGEESPPVRESLWFRELGRGDFIVTRPLVAGDSIEITGLEVKGVKIAWESYHAVALAGMIELCSRNLPIQNDGRHRRYDLHTLANMGL